MPRPRRQQSSAESGSPADSSGAATTAGMLRIIGGFHRSRAIRYTGDIRTRPMKDRVREAVFNLLGPDVKGMHAVDLFAGTGALGLEAISRGASGATFFERHFPTADLIVENAQTLGVTDVCRVIPANTLIQFRKSAPFDGPDPTAPWVVFCSPPYDLYVQQTAELMALLETIRQRAPARSWLVVECDERFDLGRLPGAEEWSERDYSPARIAMWRKA